MYEKRNIPMNDKSQKTLALALGGGAALGFAHIGFLQVLEENNIKVSAIAGTSMGSLIGAFYACGYSAKELEKISLEKIYLRQFITDVNPVTFFRKGFISGKRIQTVFHTFLEEKNIEELKIPYVAVATDMTKGKKYVFDKGPVSEAVRASIAIPGVFTPVKKEDMLLIDGGVLDNVPDDEAKKFNMDVVISVNVLGDYTYKKEPKTITGMLIATFSLIQQEYEKYKPNCSDLSIKMNLEKVTITSFSKAAIKRAIQEGREHAIKNLDSIKELLY